MSRLRFLGSLLLAGSVPCAAVACKGGTSADLFFLPGEVKLSAKHEADLSTAFAKAMLGASSGKVTSAFAVYTPKSEAPSLSERRRLTAKRELAITQWLSSRSHSELQAEATVHSQASAEGELVKAGAKAEVDFAFSCKGM